MAKPPINKDTLDYLSGLARIELDPEERETLLRDLQSILNHVAELQEVDTEGVAPMDGGTLLVNAFREDEGSENTNQGEGVEAFPETEKEYLKVPKVL